MKILHKCNTRILQKLLSKQMDGTTWTYVYIIVCLFTTYQVTFCKVGRQYLPSLWTVISQYKINLTTSAFCLLPFLFQVTDFKWGSIINNTIIKLSPSSHQSFKELTSAKFAFCEQNNLTVISSRLGRKFFFFKHLIIHLRFFLFKWFCLLDTISFILFFISNRKHRDY